MRLLVIALCLLQALPTLAQTLEEQRAQELIQAASLANQLGDRAYTIRRLPEYDQTIGDIDARAEALRQKAAVVRDHAAVIRAQAAKIREDANAGKINFQDLNELIRGAGQIAGEGAAIGGEAAKLGNDAALLGLDASRLGLAGSEAVSFFSLGLPSSALAQLEYRHPQSDQAFLQLARMKAAQASGQPELASRYGQEVSAESPLVRYIASSQAFESERSTGLRTHLRARRRALNQLNSVRFDPQAPSEEWHWALEGQSFWLADGAKYQEVELEDLTDQEFEVWEDLLKASDGESYELLLGTPELAFQQSDIALRSGDLSQATSWWQRGALLTQQAEGQLRSSASSVNSKYPDLRVSDSPRLLVLKGMSAESEARLAMAANQPAETKLEEALDLYQEADSPQRQVSLLLDWPRVRPGKTRQLAALSRQIQHPLGTLVAQINEAELAYQSGDKTEAKALLNDTIPRIRSSVAEVGVTDLEQRHYSRAFALRAKIEAEEGNAPAALASLSEGRQVSSSASLGSTLDSPEVRSVQRRRTRMRALREEKSAEQALPPNAPRPADSGSLIASNKKEFVSTARKLRDTHPEYASLLFVDPVEFSKLQSKIPAGTLVLQYFPSDGGTLYIFAVSSKDFAIRTVPIKSKELARLVRRYRSIVGRFPPPPISWRADGTRAHDYAKVFYRLHELLITPMEPEIAEAQTLAIVPAGHLHYLPFAGLARPSDQGPQFLIQRKQVVALSKASDLALLENDPGSTQNLLAFGNPDGTLPGATEEVRQLEKVFPASTVVIGPHATKQRLRTDSAGAGYLHLATHGTLNNRDPNASYITLAGLAEEGRLHPPEIFTLPLAETRLVTMSACSTALGRTNPGAEVTSLAEAFWVAGAPSVVASLWKVSDDSTRQLMIDFYSGIRNGETLAASLQNAQLQQLEGEFHHPFYWAPFVLLGDWR